MSELELQDGYGINRTSRGLVRSYAGELEFIVKDRTGREIERRREKNIVKIFAKEIISHRLPSPNVWDPNASSGTGAWVSNGLNLDDWAPKYICFGASFDSQGIPLDSSDTRYYTVDPVSGGYVPVTLGIGAEYDGGLINAIPISSPNIPLKRVERIYFEPSYQPAGVPLLEADVRAINNVIVLETTLLKAEYNGFGVTASDFFTITEVALVGAPEIPPEQGLCECDPRTLFLQGDTSEIAIDVITSGTSTVSIASYVDPSLIDLIVEGDQVKLVTQNTPRQSPNAGTIPGTGTDPEIIDLEQVSPYYLVTSKTVGGRDIVLDRTPVNSSNVPLTGTIGAFRDTFKIFSHRILSSPLKKSSDFEITVRWRIIFN